MKINILLLLVSFSICNLASAQLGKMLKNKVENKTEQTVYAAIDKTTGAAADNMFKNGKTNIPSLPKKKDTIPSAPKTAYPVPSTITFDWEVVQKVNGEDGPATHTYYFTTNGDYAGIKPDKKEDEDMSLMIYMKDGNSLQFNDKAKTITIMKMTKVVGEGAVMSKQVAEGINKKPLSKDKPDAMTISKTGKTKMICGNSADEYQVKNEGGTSSLWYAHVSFDPVKIYTMGAGRPADLTKIKNDPKMKNNMFAIPVLNKNYLMAEMEVAGQKGMETQSIIKKTTVISTAGYKIKDFSNKGLKEIIQDGEN